MNRLSSARYYDPWVGRFLSQDPALIGFMAGPSFGAIVSDPQQFNSFSYARNAPTRYTDPTGAWIVTSCGVTCTRYSATVEGALKGTGKNALKIGGTIYVGKAATKQTGENYRAAQRATGTSQSPDLSQTEPGPPVKGMEKLNSLESKFKEKAMAVVETMREMGYRLRIIWGRRTKAENDELVEKGRASPNSKHLEGKAVDMINRDIGYSDNPKEPYYQDLGPVVRGQGLIWGGDWTNPWDPNHFEAP